MRQLLLGLLLLAFAVPANARADVRVSAFYYPWYGTTALDGAYQHWSQRGHTPPDDIASAYYPARGIYSSSDRLVVGAQMDEIRSAGIDEIIVSWWGQGSAEDSRLALVVGAARAAGITVAAHLEPYEGRTVASTLVGRRVSAALRHPDVLRVSRPRPAGRGLGSVARGAARGRLHAVRADGDGRRRGRRRVRRRLHLRHRHVRRRHVRAALRRGACAAPAVRAVGRAGLRRASRQWRSGRQARGGTARRTTRCGAPRSSAAPTA